jgi:hypothetical protein
VTYVKIVCIVGRRPGGSMPRSCQNHIPTGILLSTNVTHAAAPTGGHRFSDQTMDNLAENDQPTHDAIKASFYHWDDIVHFKGRTIAHRGMALAAWVGCMLIFCRAVLTGVELHFEAEITTMNHLLMRI